MPRIFHKTSNASVLFPVVLFLMALTPGPIPVRGAPPQDPDSGDEFRDTLLAILARMEDQPLEKVWQSVDKIQNLDKDEVVPILRSQLKVAGEMAKLGCAKALIHMGAPDEALVALVELINTSRKTEIRVSAIRLLGEYGDPEDALDFLEGLLSSVTQPDVLIPLAKTLWELDNVLEARSKLVELLKSQDSRVRDEAAIALAEIDYFEGDVRDILRQLSHTPGIQGRLAASLFRKGQLSRQLDSLVDAGEATLEGTDLSILVRQKEKRIRKLETQLDDLRSGAIIQGGGSFPVIEEVLKAINETYVERERLDRVGLVLEALKGMTRSLDPFSSFMGPKDTKRFLSDMSGQYVGIGAHVEKSRIDSPLEIVKPIYGGPSHRAGILTGDQIIEVDGVSTLDLSVKEIVGNLKGKPGTTVKLKVFRRGWEDSREFEIVRRQIQVPSVTYELLPGKIGLLKLDQFGEHSHQEFRNAVLALEEDGMEGLVVDLRDNPGGLLEAAIDVVDLFVGEEELPIVSRGRPGEETHGDLTFARAEKRPDYPLVLLINQRSASASEIVAGALRDFHRATLVGRKSFGKGSVQRLIPLSPKAKAILGGESRIRLTVQYYYLPSGESIHRRYDDEGKLISGGVKPDIEVDAKTFAPWEHGEFEKLRGDENIATYVRTHYPELKKLLIAGDRGDTSRYPDFDKLHTSLDTRASKDLLRQILRFRIRRLLEDELGKELAGDIQDDYQLQVAVKEILKGLGRDVEKDPNYGWLAEKDDAAAKGDEAEESDEAEEK